MKAENKRLGRCSSCRFWKSATELLAERAGPDALPEELAAARQAICSELSQSFLSADGAVERGWCTAAEQGVTEPATMMAVNLADQAPVRMITRQDHGCIDYQPRPRRAMTAPLPDFRREERLGRCVSCLFWSGADNEANALFSIDRYTNPSARLEDAQREACALLSPAPLDPATAYARGWCKVASDFKFNHPYNLAIDPVTGAIGALITSRDYSCIRFVEGRSPGVKKKPGARMLINKSVMDALAPSASLNELMLSYMDPATLIDPNHPLSPLHAEHPLNPRNPKSLYYNPNPAFAAYVLNASLANILSDPHAIRSGQELGRLAGNTDINRPRISMQFDTDPLRDPAEAHRKLAMQARLAADFASRTVRMGSDSPGHPESGGVSLVKVGDDRAIPFDRRKNKPVRYEKGHPGGFVDRRRLET